MNESFSSPEFRIPPQDLEAEQSVLGAMMLRKESIDEVLSVLTEESFYRETHRQIFKAIRELHEEKTAVDMLTLSNQLRQSGDFETVGGVSALTAIVERVPTAANVLHYAEIVKQKSFARRTISTFTEIVAEAYSDNLSQKELSDRADSAVFNLTERQNEKNFKPISEIIAQVYDDVFYKIEHKTRVVGVPMGFPELDELTEGLQTGMYVIGARPSVGKSAMAFNIAWTAASGRNELGAVYPAGIFSLEMTEKQISQRLLCSVAQVNMKNAKKNGLTKESSMRLSRASNDLHESPIYLNDKADINIFELRAQARRMKKLYDIKLLIVDYLQLVRPGIECGTREQEVAFVSSNLKALSSDMDIPVLVLSQLSRPPKVSENRRPTLSDLRESGAIEQDADCVVFIHRENLSKDEAYPEFRYELILAKQRNGEANVTIPIRFNSWITQFESIPEAQTIEQEKTANKREWID